ncbi:hypothetical protein DQM68_12690 [Leptospira mayottensis]|uniref:Uncharacterized protein n=2 Tax=Leptospira mayottensis TaxID=1137606 RepID=A0AA87MNU6_9LEPT|nr:hypothetical protein DQM68_12690 [Leptospira mayottensis]AXR65339.1 hypothetical protein DQM28_15080 [Leptospira mayottensis]AZQ02152.1 hypothetical protein LEP1GSC190_09030 [Leptospira mayottensis 200901116]EKS00939.1 hypothetical protein LEP1GSC125_3011 [Leptospira mayottensis 200901122]TGM91283.1 hypothetical protein EHR03_18275 [Leptospira mayottensis]
MLSRNYNLLFNCFFYEKLEKENEKGSQAPIQTQQMISKILKKLLILDLFRNRLGAFSEEIKQ